MTAITSWFAKTGREQAREKSQAWRVKAEEAPKTSSRLLPRVFRRKEPTTFQRCLAVHMVFAAPRGGLS
jgi:hypothetical protein